MFTKNRSSFASSVFGKYNFIILCDVAGSEGQKVFSKYYYIIIIISILFCRPIQTQKHFHDVLSCQLIFLLHPAALHENTALQLRPFPLEFDITTFSH